MVLSRSESFQPFCSKLWLNTAYDRDRGNQGDFITCCPLLWPLVGVGCVMLGFLGLGPAPRGAWAGSMGGMCR